MTECARLTVAGFPARRLALRLLRRLLLPATTIAAVASPGLALGGSIPSSPAAAVAPSSLVIVVWLAIVVPGRASSVPVGIAATGVGVPRPKARWRLETTGVRLSLVVVPTRSLLTGPLAPATASTATHNNMPAARGWLGVRGSGHGSPGDNKPKC